MKEFRNIRERNKAQGEIEKKVGILFGMYNTNILWRYFEYMSGRYNEEISKFSNTSIEFEDIRNIIDKTLFLKQQFNLNRDCLYIGDCEMYHYFFLYNEESLKDDEEIQYLAVDHELGEIEHETFDLNEWFKFDEEYI